MEPDTGARTRGTDLLRREMALFLFVLVLVGCGGAEDTPTAPPTLLASTPPRTTTIPPTSAPTRARTTPTLVPLVTRTRAPTSIPVPTRVPGLVRCTTYQPPGTEGPVWDIEVAPDGAVWLVAFRGVARFHPARKEWSAVDVGMGPEATVDANPEIDQFRSVTVGVDGSVWLPTRFGDGAYYWDGTAWSQLTTEEGLLSDWVNEVSLAPDGAVWFATQEGVSRWERIEGTWTHYSGAGWLQDDVVHRVLFTPDGTIWFAHSDALTQWRPLALDDEADLWEIVDLDGPLAVRKALVSADGRLWLGQSFYDPGTEAWFDTVYREIHVQGLAVDSQGGLWIARSDGAVYIPEPESSPPEDWFHLGMAQGLGAESVTAIALESDALVWFGTEQGTTRCFIEGIRETE